MRGNPKSPVLIVDDYATMAEVVRNLLVRMGFEAVDLAADGRQAYTMVASGRYGLVISDWDMHPMTGLELLQQMRANPALTTTPVIIFSADATPERSAVAVQAGAAAFLSKPFTADHLRTAVETALAR
jgi:two-component system chemotaxis response regulator CheY